MATATLEKPKKTKGAKKTQSKAAPKRTAAKKNASNAGVLSPAKTVQMNVRIDADLKKQGDRAFARIGSSPSEIIRALWRYASRHANNPETLRHLVEELEGEGEAQNVILEPPRQGWEIMEEAYRALGITPAPLPEDDEGRLAYYDELKEEAWQAMLSLNEQGTAVPADTSDVTVAQYFHQIHSDFEDDLILAAVERSGADYLITNDKKLRTHAPVAAITPADMLTLLESFE